MVYIALGVVGFLIAFLFDHPRIEKSRWAKLPIGLVAFGILGYSIVMVALHPSRFTLPSAISAIGWALTAVFFFLFVYSVFIEVPFRQAYLGMRNGIQVVNTGTYAMTRHPGVLWATLGLACLFVATGSKLLLIAFPIWIIMDLAWVYLEDRFYFPKTISGYEDYKREVPMLIPTLASSKKAIWSIRQPGKTTKEGINGRHP